MSCIGNIHKNIITHHIRHGKILKLNFDLPCDVHRAEKNARRQSIMNVFAAYFRGNSGVSSGEASGKHLEVNKESHAYEARRNGSQNSGLHSIDHRKDPTVVGSSVGSIDTSERKASESSRATSSSLSRPSFVVTAASSSMYFQNKSDESILSSSYSNRRLLDPTQVGNNICSPEEVKPTRKVEDSSSRDSSPKSSDPIKVVSRAYNSKTDNLKSERDALTILYSDPVALSALGKRKLVDEQSTIHPTKKRPLHTSKPSLSSSSDIVDLSLSPPQLKPRQSLTIPVADRLRQLSLITAYRIVRPATVDDFHAFLVSLPPGPRGNYWALISALLSVQCRDKVALAAAKRLISACPEGIADMKTKSEEKILEYCRTLNFCKTKAKNIFLTTQSLVSNHDGKVPQSYKELLKLRGVGPKIAHLLRSVSFGMGDTGIVVDTHVHRIATALGWAKGGKSSTPETTRKQLEKWVPRGEWIAFTLTIVGFGQATRRTGFKESFFQFAKSQGKLASSESSVISIAEDIVSRLKGEGLKCPWDDSH